MLEARSVAVVGASVREGSVGHQSLVELTEGGFTGDVYPVNPKYEEILGFRAYPRLDAIERSVDLVILAVSNALLEDQLRYAADIGAGGAVIFASGYEPPREGLPPLTERLAAIAREAGMAVCGGNCMGFVNFGKRVRALGFDEPEDVKVGGITFLSHSGSAFSAMNHNARGLGLPWPTTSRTPSRSRARAPSGCSSRPSAIPRASARRWRWRVNATFPSSS
jgi:acetate---CoA ligase (ADP-forming)